MPLQQTNVQLEVTPDKQKYYPGDIIHIKVTVSSKKKTPSGALTASLSYNRSVNLTLGRSIINNASENIFGIKGEALISKSRHQVEREFTAVASKTFKEKGNLPAGFLQIYELDLEIPPDATPTYFGKKSNVLYVRVSEDTYGDLLGWWTQTIPVVVPLHPGETDTSLNQIVIGKYVELRLQLPRTNWVLGETIPGKLIAHSLAEKYGPIKINVALNFHESMKGETSLPEQIAFKQLAKNIIIPMGEEREYDFELDIPNDGQPSLKIPDFSANWSIDVFAGKGIFSNTSQSIPIQVYSEFAHEAPISEEISTSKESQFLIEEHEPPTSTITTTENVLDSLTELPQGGTKENLKDKRDYLLIKYKRNRRIGVLLCLLGGLVFLCAVFGMINGSTSDDYSTVENILYGLISLFLFSLPTTLPGLLLLRSAKKIKQQIETKE